MPQNPSRDVHRRKLWEVFALGANLTQIPVDSLIDADAVIESALGVVEGTHIPMLENRTGYPIYFDAQAVHASGQKIPFIKVIRHITNYGLKEAKDVSEAGKLLLSWEQHPDIISFLIQHRIPVWM